MKLHEEFKLYENMWEAFSEPNIRTDIKDFMYDSISTKPVNVLAGLIIKYMNDFGGMEPIVRDLSEEDPAEVDTENAGTITVAWEDCEYVERLDKLATTCWEADDTYAGFEYLLTLLRLSGIAVDKSFNESLDKAVDKKTELTEGIGQNIKDFITIACLKFVNKVDIDRRRFTELLQEIVKMSGWDTDRYAERPYYFTGAIIADMMEADLNRLSNKDWRQKWMVDFFENGEITFDPTDYPNIWLEGFKDWEERPIELSFVL